MHDRNAVCATHDAYCLYHALSFGSEECGCAWAPLLGVLLSCVMLLGKTLFWQKWQKWAAVMQCDCTAEFLSSS